MDLLRDIYGVKLKTSLYQICILPRETIAEVCHLFHGLVYTFTPKPFEKNTDNLLLSLNHPLWAAVNRICFKLFVFKTQNSLGKLQCLDENIFYMRFPSLLSFFFKCMSNLSKAYSSLKAIIVFCTLILYMMKHSLFSICIDHL